MSISALFENITRNVSSEERMSAALEFAALVGVDPTQLSEDVVTKLADQDEMISLLQQEVGRLNRVIVSHSDGIKNASIAGLDILGERSRQRRLEGYHDHHDDQLDDWSLASAAMAYIEDARLRGTTGGRGFDGTVPVTWPWAKEAWKPKDVRRSLVVAAALVLAEIEKLDRATQRLKDGEEEA